MQSILRRMVGGVLWAALLAGAASAQSNPPADADASEAESPHKRPLNIVSPTLGGKQVWSDELVFHDWRIQRNVVTKHFRLLDGRQYRYAWGTFQDCQARLNEIKKQRNLPPMKGQAVILLHGVIRSRSSMAGMARYLKEQGDYTVINVSYASTRETIAEHAGTLGRLLERLEGVERIHLVAHSMGNLVIRHYLAVADQPPAQRAGKGPDPRLGRFVMLAPPNQGARMARAFKDNPIYRLVWGVSGREIAEKWPALEKRLATPRIDFGIIAGDREIYNVSNPLLDEKNDFVVSVEETRLKGARDFAALPVLHSTIMDDERTREYTLRFLQRGYFISPQKRNPVF